MVELDGRAVIPTEGETISMSKQARHRVGALYFESVILEIAYVKFDENDIMRIGLPEGLRSKEQICCRLGLT